MQISFWYSVEISFWYIVDTKIRNAPQLHIHIDPNFIFYSILDNTINTFPQYNTHCLNRSIYWLEYLTSQRKLKTYFSLADFWERFLTKPHRFWLLEMWDATVTSPPVRAERNMSPTLNESSSPPATTMIVSETFNEFFNHGFDLTKSTL